MVFECDERRLRVERSPVHLRPESGGWRKGCLQDLLATAWMADDGRQRQQAVSVGVIAVMVRVDQRADGLAADSSNGF